MSMLVILVVVYFAAFSTPARAQALLDSADNSGASYGLVKVIECRDSATRFCLRTPNRDNKKT